MSSKRKRFADCEHFGFGQWCHRCVQAKELDALATKAPTDGERDKLLAEAARLRS